MMCAACKIAAILFMLVALSMGCEHDRITSGNLVERQSGDFHLVFGTEHYDEGLSIGSTSDGGFVIAGAGNGTLAPTDGNINRPLLTRLNRNGEIVWSRIYSEFEHAYAPAALETENGDFIMMVTRYSTNTTIMLFKINGSGNILDSNFYRRPDSFSSRYADHPMSRTSDGGIILTGDYTRNGRVGTFLTRISAAGTVIWDREFDRNLGLGNSVLSTNDGGFLVLGITENQEIFDQDVILQRIDRKATR